jgi:hypothetical protein
VLVLVILLDRWVDVSIRLEERRGSGPCEDANEVVVSPPTATGENIGRN